MRLRSLPLLSALVLSTALALPTLAAAQGVVNQLTVTGEGRVDVVPDMATVTLGVTSVADTAAQALAENSAQVATVIENLKAAGIEARDVQTSGLSLNPNWTNYGTDSQPRIEGYTAQNMVTVRVRALDRLGSVLDAAVKDGANTLNGLTFGLSNPQPVEDSARAAAVKDARRKADVLTGAAAVLLGPVLSITESTGYAQPMPMFRADAASAPGVPVAGGELTVGASVTIVYGITQ